MLLQLFWTYLKIGTFTLGGGYAMLPLIQREVVDRRHWIDETEFLDMIALAQAAPGIIAVNSAIFIGYQIGVSQASSQQGRLMQKLYPTLCVIATILGAVLPSFTIILTIAMVFRSYKDQPAIEAIFRGVRPAVVAMIAAPLYKMGRNAIKALPSQNQRVTGSIAGIAMAISIAIIIWQRWCSPVLVIALVILAAWIMAQAERRQP